MVSKKTLFVSGIVIPLCLLWPSASSAQAPPEVKVIHTVVEEKSDSVTLNVYFTVTDESGYPLPREAVRLDDEAKIQVTGTNSQPVMAQVGEPNSPLYLILLIDASGSMGTQYKDANGVVVNLMDQVHLAAQAAMKAAPPQTYFAVGKFDDLADNEPLPLIQDFTNNYKLVAEGIKAVKVEARDSPTCLYNALYQAIELLDRQIQGNLQYRRGIIVFTDGKDERANGSRCSTRSYDYVLTRATQGPLTPIYPIGLCSDENCSNINRIELEGFAAETLAFPAIGQRNELESLFQEIMTGLNSQWLARASEIYPHQGKNRAVLTVTVEGNKFILPDAPFEFDATRSFDEPPPAVQAKIDEFQEVQGEKGVYQFLLSITSADTETIGKVIVQAFNKQNMQVDRQLLDYAPTTTVTVNLVNYEAGAYRIQIQAEDKEGAYLKNEEKSNEKENNDILTEYSFEHTALPPEVNISVGLVDLKIGKLPIDLKIVDAGQVLQSGFTKYEVFILNVENDAQVIHSFPPTLMISNSIEITLPPDLLPAAKGGAAQAYKVKVNLSAPGGVDVSSPSVKFEVGPPPAPTIYQLYLEPLFKNPYFLGGILVILLSVTGWLVINSWPEKKKDLPPPRPPLDQTDVYQPVPVRPNEAENKAPVKNAPQPHLRLKVTRSPNLSYEMEKIITHFPCVIGREGCDINLSDDKKISRRHVEISTCDQEFFLTDLKSMNGTFIGEARLEPNTPTHLSGPTNVRLGPFTYLELDQPPS